MKTVRLEAPAKVNYRLDVLGRRPNGYHDLRMIMQRVGLCDIITISLVEEPGIRVRCGRDGVPDGPGNIAWRAADALLQLAPRQTGIEIDIDKRIPVAAGLGGGSSDCATVLTGLNELLELGLSTEQLMEVGVKLGADVPFFVYGRTALAEGIGELLSPVEAVSPVWLVLVNPNIPVSTAWVYQNLQLTSKSGADTIPRFYGSIDEICAVLHNDLEPVTIGAHPVIGEIKQMLVDDGARGSLMSGSGPTVFGLFADEAAARRSAERLATERNWFAAAMTTL